MNTYTLLNLKQNNNPIHECKIRLWRKKLWERWNNKEKKEKNWNLSPQVLAMYYPP